MYKYYINKYKYKNKGINILFQSNFINFHRLKRFYIKQEDTLKLGIYPYLKLINIK